MIYFSIFLKEKKQKIAIMDVQKRVALCTVGGNVYWYSHYRKHYVGSTKNYIYKYHIIQHFYFLEYMQK